MTSDQAERWVTISAVMVGGIYAYRRLTEATASPSSLKNVIGIGNPAPLGQFVTAWGFTFLVVSILASANPGLGGSFAILIATADFLSNAGNSTAGIFADVTKAEGATPAAAPPASSGTSPASGAAVTPPHVQGLPQPAQVG